MRMKPKPAMISTHIQCPRAVASTVAMFTVLLLPAFDLAQAQQSQAVVCSTITDKEACEEEEKAKESCRWDKRKTKCKKKGSFSPDNSDIGIALNVINRDGDKNDAGESKSYRFFDGASIYYSLGRIDDQWKIVLNLSALDFDDNIDFETGIAVGALFKPKNDSKFTISWVRGYNLMTDGSGDGWYYLVGFGWNFNKTTKTTKAATTGDSGG